jgi:hypothetical protein
MIEFGKEYYSENTYFFLKKRETRIDVYFSNGISLNEARNSDDVVSLPLSEEKNIKLVVEKIIKSKKKFSKKDLKKIITKISPEKEEIDELIDFDGTLSNSKIPIHDPTLSPTKTMDQTVFSTRQAGNPLTRGYRVYYGESVVREINVHGAFGFENTELEGEDAKEAIETFKELGVEDPKGRAKEMGYDPKLEKKKLPGSFTRKRLEEVQKEKMIKVLEDILTKKSKDSDVHSKELKTSKIFIKNLKSLKKMAEKEGISNLDIIKLMKDE